MPVRTNDTEALLHQVGLHLREATTLLARPQDLITVTAAQRHIDTAAAAVDDAAEVSARTGQPANIDAWERRVENARAAWGEACLSNVVRQDALEWLGLSEDTGKLWAFWGWPRSGVGEAAVRVFAAAAQFRPTVGPVGDFYVLWGPTGLAEAMHTKGMVTTQIESIHPVGRQAAKMAATLHYTYPNTYQDIDTAVHAALLALNEPERVTA